MGPAQANEFNLLVADKSIGDFPVIVPCNFFAEAKRWPSNALLRAIGLGWMADRRWYKAKLDGGLMTLIDAKELERQYRRSVRALIDSVGAHSVGDYLEFGVFQGASMACMHRVLREYALNSVRMFGFDSFEGLPPSAQHEDEGVWKPYQFKADFRFTKYYLTQQGVDWKRTHLLKGWFQDTLNGDTINRYGIKKASLIMVDCDMYSSAKQALTFIAPLILDTAVIIFDDWNTANLAAKGMGEKKAFTEFLQANPHLRAEEFGSYAYDGLNQGKIFIVSVVN